MMSPEIQRGLDEAMYDAAEHEKPNGAPNYAWYLYEEIPGVRRASLRPLPVSTIVNGKRKQSPINHGCWDQAKGAPVNFYTSKPDVRELRGEELREWAQYFVDRYLKGSKAVGNGPGKARKQVARQQGLVRGATKETPQPGPEAG